jgi:hypothetical protein
VISQKTAYFIVTAVKTWNLAYSVWFYTRASFLIVDNSCHTSACLGQIGPQISQGSSKAWPSAWTWLGTCCLLVFCRLIFYPEDVGDIFLETPVHIQTTPWSLVRERNILTERPPLVDEI